MHSQQRTWQWLVGGTCLLLLVAAGVEARSGQLTETFDQTYPIDPQGRLSLDNVNGGVEVTVWDANEVRVQALKKADTPELLEALRIDVDAAAGDVIIKTRYPKSESGHFGHRERGHREVEYRLTVPRGITIDSIDLVNGNLTLEGVEGPVEAETVNGRITLRGAAHSLDLSTVNGGIDAQVDAVAPGAELDLESVNGRIELSLPGGTDARLRAETVNGRIKNDFGLEVRKGKFVGSSMDGQIGGGDATIELETVNGAIHVTRQ